MPKLSDLVMQFIAEQGVRHIFTVAGGGAMHLNDSLANHPLLTPICNAHEQASAICADSYAKAHRTIGVALVTTGPGGTNAITGIAASWVDSTPVLVLSGQVKRPDRMFDAAGKSRGLRQLGMQELDIISLVSSITKYATTLLEPSQIRFELEQAAWLACSGRPGPVWLDIPVDVQAAMVDEWIKLPGFSPPALPAAPGLAAQVKNLIAAFNAAERPLLFAGNGIRLAGAEEEFTALRNVLNIPVATSWCAADLISSDDPLSIGRPGAIAPRAPNFALQNADFLLAIGARLDFSITGYAPEQFCRAAYRAVVDIDQAELQKLAPHIQQPICAGAKIFLQEMLRQTNTAICGRPDWQARCTDWKTRYPLVTNEHQKPEGRVSCYHFAQILSEETGLTDQLVSGSSGSAIEVFLLASPSRQGQRIFHSAGLGAMGFAIPSAIGISIANPQHVICVDGDGGFQFNIQELETVARLNLPIKFFVLNNGGYASIRTSQKNYFGSANMGADAATGMSIPDISRIAESYGIRAALIQDQSDLRNAIRKILAMDGPVVCDVRVIENEIRAPRIASTQLPDGRFVSQPLEDLWPFLPRAEFLANMLIPPLP